MRADVLGAAAIMAALTAPPAAARGQDVPQPAPGFTIGGGSSIAILVEDAPAMAKWYQTTLELSPVKRLTAEDGSYDIHILAGSSLIVELIELGRSAPRPADMSIGLFKAGFFVEGIEPLFEKLTGLGVTMDPTIFTDAALQARSFVFRDPEGNRLQAFERCGTGCSQ